MKSNVLKKILIVDDEPEMRIALETTLQRENYQLVCAEDGKQALEQLENQIRNMKSKQGGGQASGSAGQGSGKGRGKGRSESGGKGSGQRGKSGGAGQRGKTRRGVAPRSAA